MLVGICKAQMPHHAPPPLLPFSSGEFALCGYAGIQRRIRTNGKEVGRVCFVALLLLHFLLLPSLLIAKNAIMSVLGGFRQLWHMA